MIRHPLIRECLAELAGTFILVFLGVGVVHVAVLTGAQAGPWQVAAVWGMAIALAVYAASAVSGAHINPAMTIAFLAFRRFPMRKVPLYVGSQLAGAVLAAAMLYGLFGGVLGQFESSHGLIRGQQGSECPSSNLHGWSPGIVRGGYDAVDSMGHIG